ncbi:class I SAM-dependent methyltransferase [Selenomonas sp. KH1T6]|uniref:class I SAM-dependent methyltransferase n=1 Tax=Selenomonas sp. KH1T6 TaxID=3158784 RepID=UPI0008A7AF57|nr:hypothetical protein SAMN05216583_12024 [Selenomonas ruminantium]
MRDVLEFLPAGGIRQKVDILTVDTSRLLPKLRKLCPYARITAVTRMEEVPELPPLQGLGVDWHVLDHRKEQLPFPEEAFDYVLAEEALTTCYEPYLELMALGKLVKGTGELFTRFYNVRYQGVLEALRQGEFNYRAEHLWAKAEVVRLMDDTLFKEVVFAPGEQDGGEEDEQAWAELGFDDFSRDLATSVWLVRVCRSTAAVANLKSLYSPELRRRLAFLLHRLEYDIDLEASFRELQELCRKEQIFPDYLEDFIGEACAHQKKVFSFLSSRNFLNNL